MTGGSKEITETFQDVVQFCARVMFWLSLATTLVVSGLLIFTAVRLAGPDGPAQSAAAARNVAIFEKVLTPAAVGLVVGSAVLFWGSEFMAVGLLALAALLYFAPLIAETAGVSVTTDSARAALSALQGAATLMGIMAIGLLVTDLFIRVKQRAVQGVKAEAKYGKGIKEDVDKQNIFLGKCYQLPFCRKYVRERCPLFHAKRSCWKERTGCMCEEKIISDAMSNKTIPKDAVAAAQYIPRNGRLSESQKAERCRNCVIYNEHQRHKYQAGLPLVIGGIAAFYGLFHGPLISTMTGVVQRLNSIVNTATMGGTNGVKIPAYLVEGLLGVVMLVILTYSLKVLEHAIFKLKI